MKLFIRLLQMKYRKYFFRICLNVIVSNTQMITELGWKIL